MIKDPKQAFEEIERLGLLDEVIDRCMKAYSVDVVGGLIEAAPCDRFRVRHGEKAPWTVWSRWELFEYSCRNGLLPDASVVCAGLGELLDLLWEKAYWTEKVATSEAEMARLAFEASKDGRNVREIEEMVEERRARFARPVVVSGSGPIMAGGIPDSSNLTGSLSVTDSPSQESICDAYPPGWLDVVGGASIVDANKLAAEVQDIQTQRRLASGFRRLMQGGAPDDLTAAMEIVEKNREKWKDAGQSSDENDRSDRSDMTDTTGEGGGDHSGSGDQVHGQRSDGTEKGLDFGFELPAWPVMCRALSVVKQSTVAMAKNSGLSCEFCAHLKYWLRHMTGARTGRELLKFSVGDLRDIVKAGLYDRGESAAVESIVADIVDQGKPKVEVVGRPAAEVVTVDPEKVAVVEKKIVLPTLGEPTRFQFAGASLVDVVKAVRAGMCGRLPVRVLAQLNSCIREHPVLADLDWGRRRLEIWADGYKLTMLEGSN